MVKIYRDEDHTSHKVDNIQLGVTILEKLASEPASATEARLFYNTTTKKMIYSTGTAWTPLAAGASAMRYRGTVTDWSELPTTGMEGGDYYLNSTLHMARIWNDVDNQWDDAGEATVVVDSVLSDTSASPVENRVITTEFKKKMEKLPKEPFSGLDYRFPFNINAIEQTSDAVKTTFNTLVLNDGVTRDIYPIEIPSADPANDKAGVYTKELADAKADKSVVDNKTDTIVNASNGKSYVGNDATDLAMLKFAHDDGTLSSFKVLPGGSMGLGAKVSVIEDASQQGTRLLVTKAGVFYTKAKSNDDFLSSDELAKLSDVSSLGSTLEAAIALKADTSALNGHINDTSNPHGVTKLQLGLENVDNTSDESKPVSTAQQNALDGKVDKLSGYELARISLNNTVTTSPTIFAPEVAGTSGDVVAWMDDGKIGYKKLGSAMVFKGSKTGYELSVLTGVQNGDTFYCSEDYTTVTPAYYKGYVYTYNGSGYSNVGTVADLSKYLRKDEYFGKGVATNSFLVVNSSGEVVPASKTLDAIQTEINNKSSISWDQLQTTGNRIAKVNLDGRSFEVYSPIPPVDSSYSSTSTNPVQNKVLKASLDTINNSLSNLSNNKQDAIRATGSANQPIYSPSIGRIAACNQYAGGTNMTVNGANKSGSTASIYAPTSAGSGGQICVSSGGTPAWVSRPNLFYTNLWTNHEPVQGQEYTLNESADNFFACIVQINQSGGNKCAILRIKGSESVQHFEISTGCYTQYTIKGNKLKLIIKNNANPCEIWGILRV